MLRVWVAVVNQSHSEGQVLQEVMVMLMSVQINTRGRRAFCPLLSVLNTPSGKSTVVL
jgi:hypothetical protein